MNFLGNNEFITLLGPTTSSTASSTSAVVDCSNCDGVLIIAGVGDVASLAVSLITGSSAACEGSTVSTITVSTADHCAVFDLHKPTSRYAKVFGNPTTAADGFHVHAIKYGLRVKPVTNSSTSVAGSTLLIGSSAA